MKVRLLVLGLWVFASPGWTADIAPKQNEALARAQIISARGHFQVEVISFDTSKPYGSAFPYSDHVKLKITNNSDVTLPYITPLTKRYSKGNQIGWSRAPVIPAHDLPPKQSKTLDYYPHGHLSVVTIDKLTVEIEADIDEEEIRFFREMQ